MAVYQKIASAYRRSGVFAASAVFFIAAGVCGAADTDNDRMDDAYEAANGLTVGIDDRFGDLDNDGYPNVLEALRGTGANNALSVPSADAMVGPGQTYATISAALNALTGEDKLVIVKAGTYTETVDNAKAADSSNRSLYLIAETTDPNRTIIIPPANGDGVKSKRDIYLRGFTIPWSSGTSSTGINLMLSATTTVAAPRAAIEQCIVRGFPYGVQAYGSSTRKPNVDLLNCLLQEGITGFYAYNAIAGINHCTLCDNTHATYPGIYSGSSAVTVKNSILRNSGATTEFYKSGGTLDFTYSNVRGATPQPGTGNQNSDPLLAQGYLRAGSPCIDTALTGSPALPVDLREEARPAGSGPDIGCHEHRTTGLIALDTDGDGLSDSLELYTYGSRIYSSDSDGDRMNDGYEAAHGLNLTRDDRFGDRDGDRYPNVLEALRGTSASNAASKPTADALVGPGQTYATISAALNALTGEDRLVIVKPGVYAETVDNARTPETLNRSLYVIAESDDPGKTVIHPQLDGIKTKRDFYLGGFTISHNGVKANNGITVGLSATTSIPAPRTGFQQCVIRNFNNGVEITGDSTRRSGADLINCLIQEGLIAINTYRADVTLSHCTLCDSTSASSGGIYAYYSAVAVRNSILRNGTGTEISNSGSTLSFSYSSVRGATVQPGTGNQNSDPLLLQGYPRGGSPCINAGQAEIPPVVTDLRGHPRTQGTAPDMGCFEINPTTGSASDSLFEYLLGRSTLDAGADLDGDGVANGVEVARGTDPYRPDTDGDGVLDSLDAFPLDPSASSHPSSSPDTTAPNITVTRPSGAAPE